MATIPSNLIPEAEQLLQYLGLENLPEEDKLAVLEKLNGHLSDLIMDTMIDSLSLEQVGEMEQMVNLPEEEQVQQITDLASRVPGLLPTLHYAIQQELEVLKVAYQSIK